MAFFENMLKNSYFFYLFRYGGSVPAHVVSRLGPFRTGSSVPVSVPDQELVPMFDPVQVDGGRVISSRFSKEGLKYQILEKYISFLHFFMFF